MRRLLIALAAVAIAAGCSAPMTGTVAAPPYIPGQTNASAGP